MGDESNRNGDEGRIYLEGKFHLFEWNDTTIL